MSKVIFFLLMRLSLVVSLLYTTLSFNSIDRSKHYYFKLNVISSFYFIFTFSCLWLYFLDSSLM
ncbi:MAG: hypothetical protein LBD58_06065 [Treponema sp.]|nr:hypothetical protein [Treponema sp.]